MDKAALSRLEKTRKHNAKAEPRRSGHLHVAKIPGAAKVVIPAAGHAANIDQPQALNDAVLSFLDRLDGRQPQKAAS